GSRRNASLRPPPPRRGGADRFAPSDGPRHPAPAGLRRTLEGAALRELSATAGTRGRRPSVDGRGDGSVSHDRRRFDGEIAPAAARQLSARVSAVLGQPNGSNEP